MSRVNGGELEVMITRKGVMFRGRGAGCAIRMSKEAAHAMEARNDGYILRGDAPVPAVPTQDWVTVASDTVVVVAASTPDAPTPDAPTPDAPTPDAPTPDAPTPDALEEFKALTYKAQRKHNKALGLTARGKEAMLEAFEAYLAEV